MRKEQERKATATLGLLWKCAATLCWWQGYFTRMDMAGVFSSWTVVL